MPFETSEVFDTGEDMVGVVGVAVVGDNGGMVCLQLMIVEDAKVDESGSGRSFRVDPRLTACEEAKPAIFLIHIIILI